MEIDAHLFMPYYGLILKMYLNVLMDEGVKCPLRLIIRCDSLK